MMWGTGITRFSTDCGTAPFASVHGDWMAIGMFLGAAALVGVIIWAVLRSTGHIGHRTATPVATAPAAPSTPSRLPDSAEAIVRERFARGEIDRDEYDRLITALRG